MRYAVAKRKTNGAWITLLLSHCLSAWNKSIWMCCGLSRGTDSHADSVLSIVSAALYYTPNALFTARSLFARKNASNLSTLCHSRHCDCDMRVKSQSDSGVVGRGIIIRYSTTRKRMDKFAGWLHDEWTGSRAKLWRIYAYPLNIVTWILKY